MIPNDFQAIFKKLQGKQSLIAKHYGVDRRTIYSWTAQTRPEAEVMKPAPKIEIIDGEIHYSGDAVIAGDLHIPQHDPAMIDMFCSFGKEFETLVLNGDTLNLDSFSRFPKKQQDCGWQIEKIEARKVFQKILESFNYIIINKGNHDKRMEDCTNFNFSFEDLIDLFIPDEEKHRVYITDRGYIRANNTWLIIHPKEYAKTPGTKAIQLAEAHRMNVICAHTHMFGKYVIKDWDRDKCGIYRKDYTAIDGGHCCDENKIDYKKENKTTHGRWTQGFVLLENNQPELISPVLPRQHFVKSVEKMIY